MVHPSDFLKVKNATRAGMSNASSFFAIQCMILTECQYNVQVENLILLTIRVIY